MSSGKWRPFCVSLNVLNPRICITAALDCIEQQVGYEITHGKDKAHWYRDIPVIP